MKNINIKSEKKLSNDDINILLFFCICAMIGSFCFSVFDAGFSAILGLMGIWFAAAANGNGKVTIYGNDLSGTEK